MEAKANIPEIISPATGAGEASREVIEKGLDETARHLGVSSSCDWSGTFYQYANRWAHLYLLRELNRIDAWLVFVYFIGDTDVNGPSSKVEWKAALEVMHGALGLRRRHRLLNYVLDVFIDVRDLGGKDPAYVR